MEFGVEGAPGRRLSGLRVGFNAKYRSDKTPNKCTIKIYNLAPTSLAMLFVPRAVIRVFAGYGVGGEKLAFEGTPTDGGLTLEADGNGDRILSIDAEDGGRAFREAVINASFATPTTIGQLIGLVLASTQWSRGFIDPSIEAITLPHGCTLVGRAADIMDRIAAMSLPFGADWHVRDGTLYVVPKGTSTPEVAPLFSSYTGNLIGIPTPTKDGCKFKGLMDATLRPGRAVYVKSAALEGAYIAKDVTLNGDAWGNEFEVEVEARLIGVP